MLVHSISNQDLNTIRMNHIQHKSEVKSKELGTENTNTTVLPSYSASRSYANISFKGGYKLRHAIDNDDVETLKEELEKGTDINSRNNCDETAIILAGDKGSIECFKELRKHSELDIYAEDESGWMCFTSACLWNCKYIIQDLCDDPHFDVNYQSKKTGDNGLIVACRNGKEEAVDIILQCDDVDLTLRNKENQSAFDCAKDYPSILKKLKNYEKRQKELAEQKKTEQTQAEQKYPDKSEVYARAKERGFDIDRMNNYTFKTSLFGTFSSVTNDYGDTRLIQAFHIGDEEEFDRLLNDPDTDINEKSMISYTILEVLHESLYNPERRSLYYAEKVLQRPDVDTSFYFNYLKQRDPNTFDKDFPKLYSMVMDYHNRKESLAPSELQLDINKIAPNGEVWTEKEKQTIAKMIEEKNFAKIADLLEKKGVKLNKEYKKFLKQTAQYKEETAKAVRATETEKIRAEEQEKAKQALAKQQEELDKEKEEVMKRKEIFNNLIDNSQSIIDQGVEDAKRGFREFYNLKTEELPQNMDFEEQKIWVLNVLATRQEKLKDTNKSTPNNITKAIQDDKGNLSLDGLNFLERILDVSSKTFSEKNLLDSIASVKGNHGIFDMKKAAMFVSNISWKDNTISDVIKMVKNYKVKSLA